jgi:TolB protein
VDNPSYPGETWQALDVSLDASALDALNAARTAGERVYLVIELYAQYLYANVDNVSLQVSGSMDYPSLNGSIAYVGLDESGYAQAVRRIDPDGSDQQILWTHPLAGLASSIYDVSWKPDASEVAFSSNHESAYSAFNSDVYGVQPDGSGLRRITNPPSKAEIDAGGYQFGTVTGSIYNNYGSVTLFQLYVEGAQEPVAVDVGNFGDTVSFPALTVADLGSGSHYAVFTWSSEGGVCKEFAAAVIDVLPDQTTNVDLSFSGTCGKYNSDSISWKGDGTQLGVDVITPKKFQATGETLGSELFSAPLTANELAWSPVSDQLLYRNWIISGDSGIYLTTVGGGAGTWLVNDGGALWVTPAWLPDGSGFVFTLDNYLYEYSLSSSQAISLAVFYNEYVANPSPSPDGNYIVFERQTIQAPIQYDLWIINRANPTEMWPLTDDGQSQNPDWSRQNPPSAACPVALDSVSISGPTAGFTNTVQSFSAAITPADATTPITYAWSPEPASGQGSANASYTWATTGDKTINVTATNCGGARVDAHTITIKAAQRVYLPLLVRQ